MLEILRVKSRSLFSLAPEPSEPGIPGYSTFVILSILSIVTVIIIKKRIKLKS
ncbi:MAG: Loki-CTERM sorting domain-containing protein [Candidatus Thorarchaeota archaeon]